MNGRSDGFEFFRRHPPRESQVYTQFSSGSSGRGRTAFELGDFRITGAYQRGKKKLPWNPSDVPPPTYVKQFEVSRKSREMDPILMRHRNPDFEAKRKRREEERLRIALNNAKSRQLRVEQNYNIVTHSTFLSEKQDPPPRPARHPDTRTSYDILNHVPREKAHSVALIYPEGAGPEVIPQKVVTVEGGKKPHSHKKRDVDVLSNRFLEKHEERMAEEKRFLRETAEEKYRRTHDYNIVAGKYYDQDKERDFVKSREKLATMQGRAQQYRLPPSIRYGEGNGYNIINQEPKKTVVKNNSSVADRGLSKRTRGRQAHEENIRQHERAAAISEQRALNRPSHQRHVEVLRTGHNVISNRIFTGREGKPPPEPRAKPPVPVWDRLSRQSGQPEAGGAASRKTRGQEGNQREEEGSSASPTTAQKGSGGGEDLRDRGGNNDHSRRRVGVEADSGDPGNEQGSHLSPGAETGADAGRSTMALQEASHSKPTVPPLDLPLQPS